MTTRKDVAEKAGVSVAAVTRALNGSGYISEEKREAVLKAAAQLDYRPDPIALSFKQHRTHQLVYYVQYLSNHYYLEMYRGMMGYAAERGYMVIISGDFSLSQIGDLMVDGVILPTESYYRHTGAATFRVPVVIAGYGDVEGEVLPNVDVDVARAVDIALDYLFECGHRRIAFAAQDRRVTDDIRLTRFRRTMKPFLGANFDAYVLGPGLHDSSPEPNYFENGMASADEFLSSKLDATAILCFNDDTAIGLMSRLQARGCRVPDDISIVGIDGHLFGAYGSPSLTSVSISPQVHGRECARLLISLVEGGPPISPDRIEPYLIERGSVRRLI